jgi:hypothetical protein
MDLFSRTLSDPGQYATPLSGNMPRRPRDHRKLAKKQYETASKIVDYWQKQPSSDAFSRTTSEPGAQQRTNANAKKKTGGKYQNSAPDIVDFWAGHHAQKMNKSIPNNNPGPTRFTRSKSDGNPPDTSRDCGPMSPGTFQKFSSRVRVDIMQHEFRRTASACCTARFTASETSKDQQEEEKNHASLTGAKANFVKDDLQQDKDGKAKIRLRRAVVKAAVESKLKRALEAINENVLELCEVVQQRGVTGNEARDSQRDGAPRLTRMQKKLQWAGKMIAAINRLKKGLEALLQELDEAHNKFKSRLPTDHEIKNPCDVSPRFLRRTLQAMGQHMDHVAGPQLLAVQNVLTSIIASNFSHQYSLDGNVRGGLYRVLSLDETLQEQEDDRRPKKMFESSLRTLATMKHSAFQVAVAEMAQYSAQQPAVDLDSLAAEIHAKSGR